MLKHTGDALWYRDRAYSLIDAPLQAYFAMHGNRPELSGSSALPRGYSATWAIEDGWLYMTSLTARLAGQRDRQCAILVRCPGSLFDNRRLVIVIVADQRHSAILVDRQRPRQRRAVGRRLR